MKIAYCISGVVGGLKGKSGERLAGSSMVLNLSATSTQKHVIDTNPEIDIFIHTWNDDLVDEMTNYYSPKKIVAEPQKIFEIPKHLPNNSRVQNHYSRWYSNQRVIELKSCYETENKFTYDLVIVTRFDLWWAVDIDFSVYDPSFFWVPVVYHNYGGNPVKYGWPNRTNEFYDQIFMSNSSIVDIFYTLYDYLDEYTKPGQCESWNNISSHFLSVWHCKKMGILSNIGFGFIGYNHKSFSKDDPYHFTLTRHLGDLPEHKLLVEGYINDK